jgi:hypothetical protein
MNPNEPLRVETTLERAYSLPDEMTSAIGMNSHVIVFGLNPIDVVDCELERSPTIANDDLAHPARATQSFDQCPQPFLLDREFATLQSRSRRLQRLMQSIRVRRLQQVVRRMNFERFDSVMIVRCYKDHGGSCGGLERLEKREAIESRHFNVEEHYIDRSCSKDYSRRVGVCRLPDAHCALDFVEKQSQMMAREALVIHDENSQALRHRERSGIDSETTAPPPSAS